MALRTALFRVAVAGIALLAVIQIVPYGRAHDDPAATRQARFSDPKTQAVFDGACADCHTDHTSWPVYSNIAPVSWLVQNDVDGGRQHMNLSEWDKRQPHMDEIERVISGGGMPPLQYKVIHGRARLSTAERRRLAAGFRALFKADPPQGS
jgi:mono/diheme cytochrome c family protein